MASKGTLKGVLNPRTNIIVSVYTIHTHKIRKLTQGIYGIQVNY